MRLLPPILLGLVALTPGLALARESTHATHSKRAALIRKAPAGETRFLGKDPHGPLAVVRGHVLRAPDDGACRTWAKRGAAWRSIGRFGEIVGKARIDAIERYDVTNCDESTLVPTSGELGASIFVTGPYEPLAIKPWTPEPADAEALRALVVARDAKLPKPPTWLHDARDLPLEKRSIGYRTPDGARRMVVGGRALTVLRFDKGRWIVEHEERPGPQKDQAQPAPDRFMPLAVLDMDGDGVPEIVVHENLFEWFSDVTFHLHAGTWKMVEAGIYGSTA